jgi:hypothetical protein
MFPRAYGNIRELIVEDSGSISHPPTDKITWRWVLVVLLCLVLGVSVSAVVGAATYAGWIEPSTRNDAPGTCRHL